MIYRLIPAGDIDIQNRQLVLLDGVGYARQKIASRYKFFLAEWFLDLRLGVPFFRDVFVQNPDMRVVRDVLHEVPLSITMADGSSLVQTLDPFAVVFTPQTRSLAFNFVALLNDGSLLEVEEDDDDFIIQLSGS
jgi:hypothetical protein